MANDEHLAILKEGVEAWNAWREEHPEIEPDLEGADLKRAHLEGADLKRAHLEGADLKRAHLEGADLGYARLDNARLGGKRVSVSAKPVI